MQGVWSVRVAEIRDSHLDLHADPAIFETAVRALAEGNSIRAAARIVQVDKDTVCAWFDRAAQHFSSSHKIN